MNKYIYICLSCLLFSCGNNTNDKKLVEIDSLLNKNLYDSAYSLLSRIDINNYGENDKAYYFLLKNHALYRLDKNPENDSDILRSLRYYEDVGDKEKLARAFIVVGETFTGQERYGQAVEYFKKAETVSKEIKKSDIHVQIYSHLSYINSVTGSLSKALEYGKMALEHAKKVNDNQRIGYCIDNLGVIYYKMNLWNKTEECVKQAEPYIKYQPKDKQASMLDNQASIYRSNGQFDKAEYYLKKSLDIYPMDRTYGLLAELYSEQGKKSDVEAMWKKALHSDRLETRQYTMRPYAEWLYKQGRYEEAGKIAMQIPKATDSLYKRKQTEAIKEVQDGYDLKVADLKYRNAVRMVFMGIGILAVFLLAVWLYYHQKTQEAKKNIAEDQILMTSYTLKIEKLEKEGKERSKEAKDLRLKLDALRDRQAEVLYKGKEKFESIKNGGKANTWHKADYNDVVEYYRTINMPFVISLEQDYKSLSASNKFFLLLTEELGFDDSEISRVMGLTDGALRTMRYRIKKAHESALSS